MPDGLLLSCPTGVIGHPGSFFSGEDGFPLKTGGNDKKGTAGRAGGAAASLCHARRVLSGIQSLFSFPGEDGFPLKTGGNDKREEAGMTREAAAGSMEA